MAPVSLVSNNSGDFSHQHRHRVPIIRLRLVDHRRRAPQLLAMTTTITRSIHLIKNPKHHRHRDRRPKKSWRKRDSIVSSKCLQLATLRHRSTSTVSGTLSENRPSICPFDLYSSNYIKLLMGSHDCVVVERIAPLRSHRLDQYAYRSCQQDCGPID